MSDRLTIADLIDFRHPRRVPLAVSRYTAGRKMAVSTNGTVYLSPAMYDLVSHADGDELRRLAGAVPVLCLPVVDWSAPLPMVTNHWSDP